MNKELHVSFGSISDTGLVNEFNTDAVLEFKILNGHVFVVCDGQNGASGYGALASKLIADSIKKYFYNRSYKDMVKALTNAITYANITLFEQAHKDEKYNGIASTLAMAIYREGKLYYAYAGDSRIYLYRNNELQPLTRDHVEDPSNARGAELNVVIGKSRDIKFGVCKTPLAIAEKDIILLCTDGLSDQLSDEEIGEVIGDDNMAPEHKTKELIALANKKGGDDCISVQVMEFSQVLELQPKRAKMNVKPLLYALGGLVVLAIISYGLSAAYQAFKNRPLKETAVVESIPIKPEKAIEKKESQADGGVKKAGKANTSSVTPPKEEVKKAAESEVKKEAAVNSSQPVYYSHVIKYGENLYRLAIKYNVTQKQLININGKVATRLIAGSKLKIPVKAVHIVKKGESFSFISDKYNTKIKLICAASGVTEGAPLKEGQRLIIPLSE